MCDVGQDLKEAIERTACLETENTRLRSILSAHSLPSEPVEQHLSDELLNPGAAIHNGSPPSEKLKLFWSLCRGREDVYALRWDKGEKHGYAPAADMDWKAIHAAPPDKRKQVTIKTRTLRPLTDAAIRDHLEGKATIGVYPCRQ